MTDDEVRVEWESYERMEMLPDEPGLRLTGLREVQGTFAGSLDYAASVLGDMYSPDGPPLTLYLYGPDPDLWWWERWFYRIRERLTGEHYPTVVLASGPAKMKLEKEAEEGDEVVISGTFTKAGVWSFHPSVSGKNEEVNP